MQQAAIVTIWTLSVQLGVSFLITVFFLVLSRTQKLVEVRTWTLAWLAELVAVAASLAIVLQAYPSGGSPTLGIRALMVLFCAGKTTYALLVVRGARFHTERGFLRPADPRRLALFVAAWSLTMGLLAPEVRLILPGQWLLVALALITGAAINLRQARPGRSRWLGWIILGEGVLYLQYVPPLVPLLWGSEPLYRLADYSSLFDAGADLLLALAILVALAETSSRHLRETNRRLETSQEKLRHLVDLDPLTGLRNRRGLRPVLDHLAATGGTAIFLDVDDFKLINDRLGHLVGDGCLVEAARVLSHSFRPEDAIFRWGGDEFLVIAPGLKPEAARWRIDRVREALREQRTSPPFTVSVGIAELIPGEEPKETLDRADERMYADKEARREPITRAPDADRRPAVRAAARAAGSERH